MQVVTDMIDTYNQAPGAVQGVVLGVGALTAAVALSGGTMLIAVPKVVAFGEALQTLSAAGIPGVSRAATAGLKAASGFGRGLAATAGFLMGPWGLAMAAGAAAVGGLIVASESGAVSQEKLTNAISTSVDAVKLLDLAGQRSGVSKFLAGDISKDLKDLPQIMKDLGDEGFTAGTVLRVVGDDFASLVNAKKKYIAVGTLKEEAKSIENVGKALAQVAQADAPAASKAFSDLVKQQDLTKSQMSQLLNLMPDYKAELTNQATALGISASKSNLLKLAMGDYEGAAKSAKNPTKENADALQQMDKSAEDAAKAIDDTSKALKDLTSPTLDAREAQRQFQEAVDAVTQSVKDNGTSLDISTDKGRANESALDGIARSAEAAAGALYTQTGSQDQATAAMQAGRNELIKALGQYGITGAAAQAYADKIIGTPKDWATLFSNNAASASGPVSDLNGKIRAIPTGYNSTINVNVNGAANVEATKNAVDRLKAAIQQAAAVGAASPIVAHASGGNVPYATGGAVYGPGTGTSDSIDARLSNGEHVVTAAEVRALGGQGAMYALRAAIRSSGAGQLSKRQLVEAVRSASASAVPGFAGGGAVTAAQYAPPSSRVVVVQSAGGYDGPVIGNLTVPVPAGATVKQTVDEVMFAFRSKRRGGR
ncbi:hypothetical protein P9139_18130 [Curtobacterium flaccumfaciens]|nr:hypothetical protein P9139_18130 [Curtobacterium flaccumfaciens]